MQNNNRYGVLLTTGASLDMINSAIQHNSRYGLLVVDGAIAEVRDNNTISTNSSGHSALGLFRNATARVRGVSNTINNTPGNDAIEAYYGSQFRSDLGTLTVNGEIETAYLSQVELRDSIINGRIQVFPKGVFRSRPNSDVTVNGNIQISATGFAQFTPAAGTTKVHGDITCFGYNAALLGTTPTDVTVTGNIDPTLSCNQ